MPGSDYLVRVEDVVRASTYAAAESKWTLDLKSMSEIATTPDLLVDPAPSDPDDDPGPSRVEPQTGRSPDHR